jgi:hypothetical protein
MVFGGLVLSGKKIGRCVKKISSFRKYRLSTEKIEVYEILGNLEFQVD